MSNRLATEEEIRELAKRMVEGMIDETEGELIAEKADIVKVVRCKDCNNADYAGCPKGRCYCMEHGTYFNSDDYCSYGEREDGEEE